MERKPQMDYRETADKGETVAKDGDARKCGSNIHRHRDKSRDPVHVKVHPADSCNPSANTAGEDEGHSRARDNSLMAHGYTHHEHPTLKLSALIQNSRSASRYFWEDG
jgi:hypothetical protein